MGYVPFGYVEDACYKRVGVARSSLFGQVRRTSSRRRMTRAAVTLASGLALVAVGLVVTLAGSPAVVARTNGTPANEPIREIGGGVGACQSGEALPAGVSAIRLTLVANAGPRVTVTALSGSRVLVRGVANSGWTASAVTAPVKPLSRTVAGARVCFRLGAAPEKVQVGGSRTGAAVAAHYLAGGALPGRFTVEYLRSGSNSWWSRLGVVARHMGLGRSPSGGWIALLVALLMVATLAVGSWLAVGELR